jgi:UDP-glucose 4-epimerase
VKVVVTGGSGQLGTVILRALVGDPDISSITSIDLRAPSATDAKIHRVAGNVCDPNIAGLFAGADVVMHLAFVVTRTMDRAAFDAVNIGGSRNVFEAAARANVPQIVYASSIASYGVVAGHPVPIVEDTPRQRDGSFAYASAKFEVEAFLDQFEREHPNTTVCRIRPSSLIGAAMTNAFGRMIAAGFLPDPGGEAVPVVWDEDVADLFRLAAKERARGPFNASADDALTLAEVARIAGLARIPIPRSVLQTAKALPPLLARMGIDSLDPSFMFVPPKMIISSERARTELGWKPRYGTGADIARALGEVARPPQAARTIARLQATLQKPFG